MEKLKQKMEVSYSDPIPSDLLVDIFSRLPAKSIFRFRCVSRLWRSILGLAYFPELFFTKSLARPRLLFAILVGSDLFFFSASQPQNPLDNSTLVATRYNSRCFHNYSPSETRTPLSELVFLHEWQRKKWMICNPVTGESITLPKVEASAGRIFFGFDPINKQLKVLCASWSYNTHWVLTLGSSVKPLWRSIAGDPKFSIRQRAYKAGEICISGVLYYIEHQHYIEGSCMLVCFDFSSEKLGYIKIDKEMLDGTLINYKGNLGVLVKRHYEVVLWVLEEDAGNHKWCESLCLRSRISLSKRIGNQFSIVGMTGAGEIVFSSCALEAKEPFYIVYYNIERNTFARVNIHTPGFEELHHRTVFITTSLDYVENLKPLQSVFDSFIT
ncbi:unnamed protein product [Microthlaspi erraticum]|uniref:F-box domain-containing protein n=1 Tax=Microthlaspi erraticum TaxID=1685480 RepID=A0A6D2HFA0_9BRAS|nr:unnamed protein product [Microthlaspi erraticum]